MSCLGGIEGSPACGSYYILSVLVLASSLSSVAVFAMIYLDVLFVRVPSSDSCAVPVGVIVYVCVGFPVCVPVGVPLGVLFYVFF